MPLTNQQIALLEGAINDYDFPHNFLPSYHDFEKESELSLKMSQVEFRVRADLIASDSKRIRNGLSNVLFWGWAQKPGRQKAWVERFRNKVDVTDSRLRDAAALFRNSHRPSLTEIKKLKLPEFSGVSFVSKIRMFLNPVESATLDLQIMKMHTICSNTVLQHVSARSSTIPITAENSHGYELWNTKLKYISSQYFGGRYRVADVERGFFYLIQNGSIGDAAMILRDA